MKFEPERAESVTYQLVKKNGLHRIRGPVVAHVGADRLAKCIENELASLTPTWWEEASREQREWAATAKRKLDALKRGPGQGQGR